MANSTNKITLTLEQIDSVNASLVSRSVGPLSYAGAVGEFQTGQLIGVGSTTITLPISPALQVYIKNLHTTAKLTVTWTPQGGASAVAQVIGPSAFLLFWHGATAATYGITALSLQSDTASTPVEYFIGG